MTLNLTGRKMLEMPGRTTLKLTVRTNLNLRWRTILDLTERTTLDLPGILTLDLENSRALALLEQLVSLNLAGQEPDDPHGLEPSEAGTITVLEGWASRTPGLGLAGPIRL